MSIDRTPRRPDVTTVELVGGVEALSLDLHDYDDRWPSTYLDHARRIREALGSHDVGIEHIGSTSVPGLAAKPIVDIVVAVDDITAEEDYLDGLLAAGYVLRVREPGHRLVRTPDRDVHVHLYERDDPAVHEYLLLRDHLRTDADDRALYEHTKRTLLSRRWDDMNAYADAKTDVIHEIKARARVAHVLDDLRTLVEVESPSGDPAALAVSADAVAALLERRLGGRAELVDGPAGPHVRWSGGGTPRVLLLGHHDTVFPHGTLERRPFTVSDGRVTGPGVFDMLGGLVQAVHAVALLDDRSGVEILVTADEENGSLTSRELLEERARACGTVLVLEGAADGGHLKVGRKGCGTFEVTVTGRAAHAGLEPEAGVNALVEAAHLVLQITSFQSPEVGTTVTPTVIRSGGQSNVVPDAATIVVDVRVETGDEKDRVESAFARLTPRDPEAVLTVEGSVARPPMTPSTSHDLLALAVEVSPGIRGVSVGGGSDGNFTAALGIPTLDGLGAVGGGAHADTEHLLLDTVADRLRLVAGLVRAVTA